MKARFIPGIKRREDSLKPIWIVIRGNSIIPFNNFYTNTSNGASWNSKIRDCRLTYILQLYVSFFNFGIFSGEKVNLFGTFGRSKLKITKGKNVGYTLLIGFIYETQREGRSHKICII